LTVLLPVRNGGASLVEWLDRVSTYADAIIALDDGSTDSTRSVLEKHPCVTRVLTNPPRDTYAGWDDLRNRQRLVHAALADESQWLLFLDADERLSDDDARALREFLAVEAQAGYAYGFEVFRMVDDDHHFDPRAYWVFRLFSAADAETPLGSSRLHFVPVPIGIPRNRWLYTTLRIQHFGSLTAEHRAARHAKYRQADPDHEHQDDYDTLLGEPDTVLEWPERPAGRPVLVGARGRYADNADAVLLDGPAITAVVIAQDDEAVIARSLNALAAQHLDESFEVIVVCSGSDGTAARARAVCPGARIVELPDPALPGEARNAGLWMANGEYITFPGSHVWVTPGSLGERVAAHDAGWDLVTVSVVNGNTTRPGWASYFLDHAAQTPSRESGQYSGVPGHASYVTRQLRSIGGFPEDVRTAEDTVVNRQLFQAGRRTYFCAESSFVHASPSTTVHHLVRHHFQRGRGLGRMIKGRRRRATLTQIRANRDLPRRRLRYIDTALDAAGPDQQQRYRQVRRLVIVGALSASAGAWYEMIRAAPTNTPPAMTMAAPIQTTAPLLAIGGRSGEARSGLLGAGTARQAAQRLATFTRYARHVRTVRPALALIVTSATITAEQDGTYCIHVADELIDTYLHVTQTAGIELLLQVQPGAASLRSLVERWQGYLDEPNVGLLIDLRPNVAFGHQADELNDVVEVLGRHTLVATIGETTAPNPATQIDAVIDLRRPNALYPHEMLRQKPHTKALLYQ
jgi:glycosyltransferase involved in cell wall biosynthesis